MVGLISLGAMGMACYIFLLRKVLQKRDNALQKTQEEYDQAKSDGDKALKSYEDIQKQLEKALKDRASDRLNYEVEIRGLQNSNRQLRADLYPTYV